MENRATSFLTKIWLLGGDPVILCENDLGSFGISIADTAFDSQFFAKKDVIKHIRRDSIHGSISQMGKIPAMLFF